MLANVKSHCPNSVNTLIQEHKICAFVTYLFPVQYALMTCVGFDAPIPRCI